MEIIPKPWGEERIWAHVPGKYAGKFLHVTAGHRLSLQYHRVKHETLLLVSGHALMQLSASPYDTPTVMRPDRVVDVPPGTIHRIEAITDSVILEVSTDHLDDVVRLNDDYDREDQSSSMT